MIPDSANQLKENIETTDPFKFNFGMWVADGKPQKDFAMVSLLASAKYSNQGIWPNDCLDDGLDRI